MQPGMISMLVRTIACREIADESYILADLRFKCHTDSHIYNIGTFIIPSFLLWGLIIPFILFYYLYRERS